jgi:hypothetical protein
MRYIRTAAFARAYEALDPSRKARVDRALQQLGLLFAERQRPFGMGFKALKPGIWEIRAGLGDRVVFRWTRDTVELLIVGTHDDIRRLLKRLSHIRSLAVRYRS